jgi:hypothetical protein
MPVAVTSPVPSSKSVLISLSGCRACGSSSATGCGKEAFFVRPGDGAAVRLVSQIIEMTQEFRGVLQARAFHVVFLPVAGLCGRCQILAAGAASRQAADRGTLAVDPGGGAGGGRGPTGRYGPCESTTRRRGPAAAASCGRARRLVPAADHGLPAQYPRAALAAGYLADATCLTQTSLAQRFRRGRHEAGSGRFPVIGADSPAWRLALSRVMTWSDR